MDINAEYDYQVDHVADEEFQQEQFQEEEFQDDAADDSEDIIVDDSVRGDVYTADGQLTTVSEDFVDRYPEALERDIKYAENDAPKAVFKITAGIFALIWALLGIFSLIASVLCFADEGTFEQKIVGFLIALILGPFCLIYVFSNKSYCPDIKHSIKKLIRHGKK
jgi:hypothetical protein